MQRRLMVEGPSDRSANVIPALSRDPPSFQRQRIEAEILGKIAPGRIDRMDQIVLPRARPAFDALLADYGLLHRLVRLEPDEPLDSVMLSEPANSARAMLVDAAQKVGRHTRIQCRMRRSREHVNARLALHRGS